MNFADLPQDEQTTRVSAALIALLGDHPAPRDYLALSLAAQDIAEALQVAFVARALPRDWLPEVRRVSAA